MTYDKTTRKKILAHAESHGVRATLRKFDVNSQTYYAWKKQEAEGYVKPERKSFYRKMNPLELKSYVEENPNQTLVQIGEYFGVSDVAVLKALQKLGFSFKKRNFSTPNEMKQKERLIKNKSNL